MESNNRKKKLSMTSALLVVAMISLVGVGFALSYSGSAVTNIPNESSEYVTVDYTKTGFDSAVYTVNTSNNGTNVTLNTLTKWVGNVSTAQSDASTKFNYVSGESPAFEITTGETIYHSAVAGSVSLSIAKSDGATADTFSLSITGAQAPLTHQYGLSLVWTYKIGTGTEMILVPASGISTLDLSSGPVTVLIQAYVVYSGTVNHDNIGDISPFTLTGGDVTFTVNASKA